MRRRFVLFAAPFVVIVACNRKVDEPTPIDANPSSPPASSSPPTVASPRPSSTGIGPPTDYVEPAPTVAASNAPDEYAPFGPKEYKEYKMHISNEDCEKAAAKKNLLEGLPEHDKKGTLLLSACLMQGNLAWYRCVLTTDKIENFNWCSRRYLIPPDEVKLKQQ